MLFVRVLLAIYWVLLFVVTHLPPATQPELPATVSDKHLHLASYAVLAALLAVACYGRVRLTLASAARLLALIAAYAVFEELTQIPAGRTAQWGDLAADLAGAAVGLAVYQCVAAWRTKD